MTEQPENQADPSAADGEDAATASSEVPAPIEETAEAAEPGSTEAATEVSVPEEPAPDPAPAPTVAAAPGALPPPVPPPSFAPAPEDGHAGASGGDRPEVAIGAAFAAGFAMAMILRRFAR